ncbi:hypothetical protein ACIBCT_21405 [Streptosporangium sp. NPDC050855]|uniref:hypothetical protein n=1 Tax=Streptosporangium sp. NPDC050855 TaxID=3366194 RepID=UPI0037A9CBE4
MFTDKGDTYHDNGQVTCAACSRTSTIANPLMDYICPCGRSLNGGNRRNEPDLT